MIKINRSRRLATIGDCPGSFEAMLEAIPDCVIEALTSRQIAALVDANWRLAGMSKALSASAAISEGGIWDARREIFREFRV